MARVAVLVAAVALVAAAFAVTSVNAHAKLVSPAAWNPNPSKTATCGGSGKLPMATTWVYTTTQTIQWQTVAGDGLGYICAYVDTTGSANPSVQASQCAASTPPCGGSTVTNVPANTVCLLYSANQATNPNPTTNVGAVVTYQINPPVATCGTGGTSSCTVVVFSSSAWFACTSVGISNVAIATQPPPTVGPNGPQAQVVNDLTFCTMMNGLNLIVPSNGQTLEQLDSLVQNTYNANLNSPLVFSTPSTDGCKSVYQRFICYQNFIVSQVTNGGPCQDICNQVVSNCQPQSSHSTLFPCTTYPQQKCADDAVIYSLNGQVPPGGCCTPGQAVGFAILAVVLAVLIFGTIFAVVLKTRYPQTFDRYADNTRYCWDDMMWKLGCGKPAAKAGQHPKAVQGNVI